MMPLSFHFCLPFSFSFAILSLFLLFPTVFPSNFHSSGARHFHGHHHNGHLSDNPSKGTKGQKTEQQKTETAPPNAFPCACGGHSAGGSARWVNGMAAHGMPLFLFPDNVARLVDVALRSENAFHRDNDDLARHLFHLLAHQFPRKWFIVGVGTMPPKGVREPQMWALEGMDVLNGTVQLQNPHGNPFFDGRRFQRENGSRLWYFVCAMDPTAGKATEELPRKSLAKCLAKKGCLSLDSFASICANDRRPLGLAVKFGQNSQMSIFVSEPLTMDTETMELTKEMKECEGNEEDETRGEQRQHILVVAAPEGKKE